MAKKKTSTTTESHIDMAPQDLSNMDPHPKEVAGDDVDVTHFNDVIRDEINAKRRAMLEAQTPPEEEIIEKPAEDAPSEVITPPVDAPAEEIKEPAAGSPEREKRYTLNVNGQNIEYSEQELLAQAQRGVGAETKFREAAELRRQAEALMFSSQQNSQPQPAVNNNTPQQQLQSPTVNNDALRDIARRMNYGTEEDQVNALREAGELFNNQAGRAQGPTPNELIQIATQNALAVLDTRNEQQILSQEFPDIVADVPIAYATDLIAQQLTQKYQALGVPKQRVDLLREAGLYAREKYLQRNIPSEQPNSSVPAAAIKLSDDKIERKRTAPQPPSAASKVASDPNSASSGISGQQALEEMRRKSFQSIAKSRGQQAYN